MLWFQNGLQKHIEKYRILKVNVEIKKGAQKR